MRFLSALANASAGEKTLFEELWEYFVEKYFTPDLVGFENLDFSTSSIVTLQTVIIGLTLGIVIASGISIFDRGYMGAFVRTLIENEVFSPDKAVLLSDIGFHKSMPIRSSIKRGRIFKGWVKCVEEEEYLAEMQKKREEYEANPEKSKSAFKMQPFKINVDTMHFYIPEEKQYKAEVKFNGRGSNIVTFIFVAIVALALCVLTIRFLPELLRMLDNFISMFNTNNKIV